MFAYCGNDPVNKYDYSGYWEIKNDPESKTIQIKIESKAELYAAISAMSIPIIISTLDIVNCGFVVALSSECPPAAVAAAWISLERLTTDGLIIALSASDISKACNIYRKQGYVYLNWSIYDKGLDTVTSGGLKVEATPRLRPQYSRPTAIERYNHRNDRKVAYQNGKYSAVMATK